MPELRDAVRDAFDQQKKRMPVPWWLPRLGLGVAMIIAVVALVPHGSSAPKIPENIKARPPDVRTAPDGPAVPATTANPSPPTVTAPPSGTKVLTDAGGSQVTVEQGAYDAATAVVLSELGPDSVIVTEVVQARSAESVTFTFTVAPAGSATPTVKAVTVARTGSGWSRR